MSDRLAEIKNDLEANWDLLSPAWEDRIRWLIEEVERLRQQRDEATKPLGVDVKGYNTVAEWNALVEENERRRQRHERDLRIIETGSRMNAALEIEKERLREASSVLSQYIYSTHNPGGLPQLVRAAINQSDPSSAVAAPSGRGSDEVLPARRRLTSAMHAMHVDQRISVDLNKARELDNPTQTIKRLAEQLKSARSPQQRLTITQQIKDAAERLRQNAVITDAEHDDSPDAAAAPAEPRYIQARGSSMDASAGPMTQSYPGEQKPDWTGLDGYGDNAHAEPR